MKKLNLKLGGIKEMLTREQMKKVTGGDGYGYVDDVPTCKSSTSCNTGCSYGKYCSTCCLA